VVNQVSPRKSNFNVIYHELLKVYFMIVRIVHDCAKHTKNLFQLLLSASVAVDQIKYICSFHFLSAGTLVTRIV